MRIRFLNIEDAKDHIITGIILVFAISLMVARNLESLHSLRSASITLFSYLEEPLSNVRIYRQALATNEQLQRKNILLLDELSRLRSVQSENESYREMLGFRDTTQWDMIPVQIVGKNLTGLNNIFTVSAGSKDSVSAGMPLVTADGLAGKVILTSNKYAEVMPTLNVLFRVSARIQGSRAYGVVEWEGKNLEELTMLYVPRTIPVDSGMVVETSGLSSDFPARLPIGTVVRTEPEPGRETQIVYLRPAVNIHTLAEGFIIQYKPDPSLLELDTQEVN
jgi:rod shape-determining protein MreC